MPGRTALTFTSPSNCASHRRWSLNRAVAIIEHSALVDTMKLYGDRIIDRQVGRNAQLFAASVSALESPEGRYPYLRILVSIVEQAHPEWIQAPKKERQIAHLIREMSGLRIVEDEVADVVRMRDEERGFYYD